MTISAVLAAVMVVVTAARGQVRMSGPHNAVVGSTVHLVCELPAAMFMAGELPLWRLDLQTVWPQSLFEPADPNVSGRQLIRHDGVLVATLSITPVSTTHSGLWTCHPQQAVPHSLTVTASQDCYSLSISGDCEFFNCLERSHPCGSDGYSLRVAAPLCANFVRYRQYFTESGKEFLSNTLKCVTGHMWSEFGQPHVDGDEELLCPKMLDEGQDRLITCVVRHRLCTINPLNMPGLLLVFSPGWNPFSSIPAVYWTGRECRAIYATMMWNSVVNLFGGSTTLKSKSSFDVTDDKFVEALAAADKEVGKIKDGPR